MAERDDLNIAMIGTVGAVSVILTVAVVFGIRAIYFRFQETEMQRKVIQVPTADANSKLAEQDAKLARYSWVSRESRTVTIPIDQAMELVVAESRAKNRNAISDESASSTLGRE